MKNTAYRYMMAGMASVLLASSPMQALAGEFTCPDLGNKDKQTINEMVQGKEGWFFRLAGDLETEFQLRQEARGYLTRLQQGLAKRGTQTVFLSVPPRGVSAYQLLDKDDPRQARYDGKTTGDAYGALLTDIRETGMIVPDLREASLATPGEARSFFFRRDHHWTPEGARAAAKALKTTLTDLPAYQALKPKTYETKTIGKEEMKHTMALELQRLCTSDIPGEPFTLYETQLVASGADALFGDAGGENKSSVLVGSSFSDKKEFNFDGFIAQETGLDIANFALSAGLLFNALVSYTSSPQFDKMKPPFLIWEAPGNYDLNKDTSKFFRQIIPATHGICDKKHAIATAEMQVTAGKGGPLLKLDAAKKVSGHSYYIVLTSSNNGMAKFTLQMDYDDGDGEWFTVDRSEFFKNHGRFFVELTDEIESALTSVTIEGMDNLNTNLTARVCKAETTMPQS